MSDASSTSVFNDYDNTIIWGYNDTLTVEAIMNIYRFGSLSRPEEFSSHIRDTLIQPTVTIDVNWFFTDGPGRFTKAFHFEAVKEFFRSGFNRSNLDFDNAIQDNDGNYGFTGLQLIEAGVLNPEDFLLGAIQADIAPDTDDYFLRAFVFSNGTFELSNETIFFLNPIFGGAYIAGAAIAYDDDNFNFQSDPSIQLGNDLILEPFFDPFGLGENSQGNDIEIGIAVNGSNVVGTYTREDYASDQNLAYRIINTRDLDNFDRALIGSSLVASFTPAAIDFARNSNINIDDHGRALIYGTNGGDLNLSRTDEAFTGLRSLLNLNGLHIVGGRGDDEITGSRLSDFLEGNDDNDTIRGRGGDDELFGGNGSDLIRGGSGNDVIFGGTANADGSDAAADDNVMDRLYGGIGDDVIFGGGGDDEIYGGADDDVLIGGNGDDIIVGASGNDSLFGGDGNDTLNGSAGMDFITGGIGEDTINGGSDDDEIGGGDGNDILNGGGGRDFIAGGEGDDVIAGGAGFDNMYGEAGDDTFVGGAGRDLIHGGDGIDLLDYSEFGGTPKILIRGDYLAAEVEAGIESPDGRRTDIAISVETITLGDNGSNISILHSTITPSTFTPLSPPGQPEEPGGEPPPPPVEFQIIGGAGADNIVFDGPAGITFPRLEFYNADSSDTLMFGGINVGVVLSSFSYIEVERTIDIGDGELVTVIGYQFPDLDVSFNLFNDFDDPDQQNLRLQLSDDPSYSITIMDYEAGDFGINIPERPVSPDPVRPPPRQMEEPTEKLDFQTVESDTQISTQNWGETLAIEIVEAPIVASTAFRDDWELFQDHTLEVDNGEFWLA